MSLAPPRPKGPPLNAMRAFEAAARLQSFVAAAEELSVTPGAVSQHIKTLEAWADRPLFQRHAQGVALTAAGRALLPDFVAAFDALGAATHALRSQRRETEIHIAALPSIAQLWLPARLGRIRRQMPDLKISVTAMETAPNLARELFDMSLFFQPPQSRPDQIDIEHDIIFPVCAPHIAEKMADDRHSPPAPLLHDQTWQQDWASWSQATGITFGDPETGPRYSLYSLALEEAKSGAGILMGHGCLVSTALQEGSLVRLSQQSFATGLSLVLSLAEHGWRGSVLHDIVELLRR